MADMELCLFSATELSSLVSKKEISPLEIVATHLSRIQEINDTVKAFIFINGDQAMEAARKAENDINKGSSLGPLHGIPVAYKDIYHVKGLPTTAGSKVMSGYIAERDSAVAANLRQSGAICLGKLNTWEFASGGMELFGDARNPWNTHMITGGSSSGSASALAASLVPLATGSDTGGSVRNPAAYCGIVGLKPTTGLIRTDGIIPLSWSLDCAGPMARRVSDVALMFYGMAGEDILKRHTVFKEAAKESRKDLTLGIPRTYFFDYADPEVVSLVRAAADHFEKLGAAVEEVDLPYVEYGSAASFTIAYTEAFTCHRQFFFNRSKHYTLGFIGKISAAGLVTAQEHFIAQEIRKKVSVSFKQALSRVDVIITPTNPYPAHPIGTPSPQSDMRSFARPVSLTGLPALSVPCGFTKRGLPVGMQLIGRANEEDTLLHAGNIYEKTTEWHTKRPPIGPGDLWEPKPVYEVKDETVIPRWVLDVSMLMGLNYIDEEMAEVIAGYMAPLKAVLTDAWHRFKYSLDQQLD